MKRFEVDKTYTCRSVCDHNCIWTFKVVKRTQKSVWLEDERGEVSRRLVKCFHNEETLFPLGIFSMCPVLTA